MLDVIVSGGKSFIGRSLHIEVTLKLNRRFSMYLYVSMWFRYSRVVGEDTNHGQSEAYTILTMCYFEHNIHRVNLIYINLLSH